MKLDIFYGNDVFVLPKEKLLEKAESAEAIDFKLLLLIASDHSLREDFNSEAAADKLKCTKSEAEASLKFWLGAGIIKTDNTKTAATKAKARSPEKSSEKDVLMPADETPNYTGDEIEELVASDKNLKWLVDECQHMIGKMLNTTEINKIIGMSDYLRLEHEHILLIVMYCINQGKKSVKYIENTAYALYNEGVDTLAKFEMYIKAREDYREIENKLRTLFGTGSRAFTAKEKDCMEKWILEWYYPYEIIELAYEITINNTNNHKFSLPYIHKVLNNWYDNGYKTVSEIEAALDLYKQNKDQTAKSNGSFDTDEFFEAALERSYEKLKKDN